MEDLLSKPYQAVGESLSSDVIDSILEEIAGYEVQLEEDPTLPDLGTRYLQSVIAKCRAYLNRVQYYLQLMRRYERKQRIELRQREADLEFKIREKLADDPIVRRQPSIEDRKALASSLLKEEHETVARMRISLLNLEESVKLVKMAYDHLNRTNADIKLQRHLVRDDKLSQMSGEEGYSRPHAGQDRSVPGGMAPVVQSEPIDPKDLLDPNRRPADMPEPVNAAHARQIADFFSRPVQASGHSKKAAEAASKPAESESAELATDMAKVSYDDLLR